jgi:hypothetical protein
MNPLTERYIPPQSTLNRVPRAGFKSTTSCALEETWYPDSSAGTQTQVAPAVRLLAYDLDVLDSNLSRALTVTTAGFHGFTQPGLYTRMH